MPFSSYGILNPPFVSVTLTAFPTSQGFTFAQEGWAFGSVDTVNYIGNRVRVGDSVLFKKIESVLITRGTLSFFIVDENNCLITESPLL